MENFKITNKIFFDAGGKSEAGGDDKLTIFLWGLTEVKLKKYSGTPVGDHLSNATTPQIVCSLFSILKNLSNTTIVKISIWTPVT
jgi:hypothetical protein